MADDQKDDQKDAQKDDQRAAQVIEAALKDAGLAWESTAPGSFVVTLPGTRKLSTTVSLIVGRHSLSLNAFVIRHPDENESGVHRWLLERNLKLYGVSYAVDPMGDVYVTARLPLAAVTAEEIDRLLGQVLEAADGAFNTLLELGFATAIRKEYEWRVSRGEPTRNLEAFAHLTRRSDAAGPEGATASED
ncbi:YbjN domain-containing protein [Streptomyces thermospinosisporus]|uniref:YbjN domain-containing protein n=1 Tax=Streptomyces thermospinosisporus TaxID=161482 RepID=A0ABP4JL80_9ACTN